MSEYVHIPPAMAARIWSRYIAGQSCADLRRKNVRIGFGSNPYSILISLGSKHHLHLTADVGLGSFPFGKRLSSAHENLLRLARCSATFARALQRLDESSAWLPLPANMLLCAQANSETSAAVFEALDLQASLLPRGVAPRLPLISEQPKPATLPAKRPRGRPKGTTGRPRISRRLKRRAV